MARGESTSSGMKLDVWGSILRKSSTGAGHLSVALGGAVLEFLAAQWIVVRVGGNGA